MGHETLSDSKPSGEINVLLLFLMLASFAMGYIFLSYKTDEELLRDCQNIAKAEGGRLTRVVRGIFSHECLWTK